VECTSCTQGKFVTTENTCALCDNAFSGCAYCSTVNDTCTCKECKTGFYLDDTTGQCIPCDAIDVDCVLCHQRDSCAVCDNCTAGFFLSTNEINGRVCVDCENIIPNCQQCSERQDSVACVTCQYGYYLLNNACLSCSADITDCTECAVATSGANCGEVVCTACQAQQYAARNNTCVECWFNCPFCTGCALVGDATAPVCTTCHAGFALVNTTCVLDVSLNAFSLVFSSTMALVFLMLAML